MTQKYKITIHGKTSPCSVADPETFTVGAHLGVSKKKLKPKNSSEPSWFWVLVFHFQVKWFG